MVHLFAFEEYALKRLVVHVALQILTQSGSGVPSPGGLAKHRISFEAGWPSVALCQLL